MSRLQPSSWYESADADCGGPACVVTLASARSAASGRATEGGEAPFARLINTLQPVGENQEQT